MQLYKLNGTAKVNVVAKNSIDWDKKVSIPQLKVKSFIKEYWFNDVVKEEFIIPGSKLRIDIFNYSKKIAIEVSPDEYHVKFNQWLHKDRFKFLSKVKADESKRNWCIKNNIKLIELYSEDIKNLSVDYIFQKYDINL